MSPSKTSARSLRSSTKPATRLSIVEAGVDAFAVNEAVAADLLIVLGGPIGVYETEHYPHLGA